MRNELAVTAMPACLTYMTPARGGWSVVRRALLLPESYLFFIGMPACMRHIILSSIELGVEDRRPRNVSSSYCIPPMPAKRRPSAGDTGRESPRQASNGPPDAPP